mgnify:FL=1
MFLDESRHRVRFRRVSRSVVGSAVYSPSLGDAYAVTATKQEDNSGNDVTLLVGADDDDDDFEEENGFNHLSERFRDEPA